ncbi:hypothetical protein Bca4012_027980 [Brassica carinata]
MKKRGCSVGIAISCVYLAIVLLLLSSALATSSQVSPPPLGNGGKTGVRTLMQLGEGENGSAHHSRCKRGSVRRSCSGSGGKGDTNT